MKKTTFTVRLYTHHQHQYASIDSKTLCFDYLSNSYVTETERDSLQMCFEWSVFVADKIDNLFLIVNP